MQKGGALVCARAPAPPAVIDFSFARTPLKHTHTKRRQTNATHTQPNATQNGKPWRWNCVQGGSWQNAPARVLEVTTAHNGGAQRLATRVVPRNWGGGQLMDDVVMTCDVQLLPDSLCPAAKITYSMTYT